MSDWQVGSLEIEEWRPVPNGRGYEVSNLGRVRRGDRMLKPCLYSTGYRVVDVHYEDGTHRRRGVHTLVCEAFIRPALKGEQVCHGNGEKEDNRLANLRYGSAADNMLDQFLHGSRIRGDRHPGAKLSYAKADEIRRRNAGGEGMLKLAREYGVDKKAVLNLIHGKTWVRPASSEHRQAIAEIERVREGVL